ncbi:hypothetical protein VHARVF571_60086 [Vibrio harveyi]|nr:hypothetical protein VHARVF571_60086 [Vibrio harveyi]
MPLQSELYTNKLNASHPTNFSLVHKMNNKHHLHRFEGNKKGKHLLPFYLFLNHFEEQ